MNFLPALGADRPVSHCRCRLGWRSLCLALIVFLVGVTPSEKAHAWSTKVIGAADAFFDKNSSTIDAFGQDKLHALVQRIRNKQFASFVFVVAGYSDESEPDSVSLSQKRAEAVRIQLMQLGVGPRNIYFEGRGADALHVDRLEEHQRIAEIEFVGDGGESGADAETYGVRLMTHWYRDSSPQASRKALERDSDEWDAMTPLQFLPTISDRTRRTRFIRELEMVAVREHDDQLLRVLQVLKGAGLPRDDPSAALLAGVFGTPYARTMFAAKLEGADVRHSAFRDLALRVWCDADAAPLRNDETMRRLKVAQLLPVLSSPEQYELVSCASRRRSLDDIKLLRSFGVSIDAHDATGRSALHWAVRRDEHAEVQFLLSAGANPNLPNEEGQTPLHEVRAARSSPMVGPTPVIGLEKLWNLLVAAGADVDARDSAGATPTLKWPPTLPIKNWADE